MGARKKTVKTAKLLPKMEKEWEKLNWHLQHNYLEVIFHLIAVILSVFNTFYLENANFWISVMVWLLGFGVFCKQMIIFDQDCVFRDNKYNFNKLRKYIRRRENSTELKKRFSSLLHSKIEHFSVYPLITIFHIIVFILSIHITAVQLEVKNRIHHFDIVVPLMVSFLQMLYNGALWESYSKTKKWVNDNEEFVCGNDCHHES